MRIAILVDALMNRGGVERMMLEIAKHYNADIYAGIYKLESTFPEFKDVKVTSLVSTKLPGSIRTLKLWYEFSKLKLDYDFYLMCGSGSLNAAKNNKPNIWYCTAPSRYLYDLHENEMKYQKWPKRELFKIITNHLRKRDQSNMKNIGRIISISKNTHARVKKYYSRDSDIVYPFVDVSKYRYIETGDFYLSAARLDRIKRVDLIINAFKKIPDKKLVIVSDGPEKNSLVSLASGCANISFSGYVSEEKLKELYGKCIATIYLSYKEDFGLIPIEGNAAGKPCIATNDGGFRETIQHKKTGYLVDEPENTKQVVEALNWMSKERSVSMKEVCIRQSKKFSQKKILKQIDNLIELSSNQG
ncbi:MAG: glycosyltransferase [archaeon]